jgi:hypothetical protein
MPRTKKSKTKHNSTVRKLAKEYEDKGYEVKADLGGFKKPDTIGGLRPDLRVKKGKQETLIEVETPDSVDSARDQNQQQAFKKWRRKSDK